MARERKSTFVSQDTQWRMTVSRFCAHSALLALFFGVMIIAALLIEHWLNGDWPFRYWGNWDMNHGPWRYSFGFDPRGAQLNLGLVLIVCSLHTSFLALILRRNKVTAFVFAICFASFWLSMHYLYWLTD
jgi:hypothetical protein